MATISAAQVSQLHERNTASVTTTSLVGRGCRQQTRTHYCQPPYDTAGLTVLRRVSGQ